MHKLVPGVASHSYALQVAIAAGLPVQVIRMAQLKMAEEDGEAGAAGKNKGARDDAAEPCQAVMKERCAARKKPSKEATGTGKAAGGGRLKAHAHSAGLGAPMYS